jgi:hypothetical protein
MLKGKTERNIKNKEQEIDNLAIVVRVKMKELREAENGLSKEHATLKSLENQIGKIQIREAI